MARFPLLTKTEFEQIGAALADLLNAHAATIRTAPSRDAAIALVASQHYSAISTIATALAKSNPAFDRAKFLASAYTLNDRPAAS